MKAKFIEKYFDNEHHPILIYEYKGFKYEVIDYGWKGGEPLNWQHRNEQTRIDAEIERMENRENSPKIEIESAEKGLEMFWEYVNS